MWRKREDIGQRLGTDAAIPTKGRSADDHKMTERLEVRITPLSMRRIKKLFQRHRDEFAWEVKADQARDMIEVGLRHYEDRAKNPDEDMRSMRRMADTLDAVEGLASRHARLDRAIAYIEDEVQTLVRNGDLGAVREALSKFYKETTDTKDAAIKARRETEFDMRWGRLWDSLNRNMSLDPSKFTKD